MGISIAKRLASDARSVWLAGKRCLQSADNLLAEIIASKRTLRVEGPKGRACSNKIQRFVVAKFRQRKDAEMSITLTPKLKKEYQDLFASCTIKPDKKGAVGVIREKILANQQRYEQVEQATRVPWYVVATIHSLEGSLNFKTHLHNGDPLTKRTIHVPKGRPPGTPPFKWEESAVDAIRFDNMTSVQSWTLPVVLFKLEGFNGFGYRTRHPEVLTPYLSGVSLIITIRGNLSRTVNLIQTLYQNSVGLPQFSRL